MYAYARNWRTTGRLDGAACDCPSCVRYRKRALVGDGLVGLAGASLIGLLLLGLCELVLVSPPGWAGLLALGLATSCIACTWAVRQEERLLWPEPGRALWHTRRSRVRSRARRLAAAAALGVRL